MTHQGFTTYRILCVPANGLEAETAAFHLAVAQFAEDITIPAGILFAVASLPSGADALANRHGIESNLRTCDFFIQIFGSGTLNPLYGAFVRLALECQADPGRPMRRVAVCFQDANDAPSNELRELRAGFADRRDVHGFRDTGDLATAIRAIFQVWYEEVKARP